MRRKLLVIAFWLPLALFANAFPWRLYIEGYYPMYNNKVDIYKVNKGLNIYKQKPYIVSGLALERSEKVDFESQRVIISTQVAGQKIIPDIPLSFDAYLANMKRHAFRKSLNEKIRQYTQTTAVSSGGLIGEFVLELPDIAIPKAVKKVLGSKAGRLNLDGTQKISMAVSSKKRKQVPIYELQNRRTFDIKMEQETNLRLTGTIGEKIAVNLKYNSSQDDQLFDPNNINIKYTGEEDEIVKSIEAGNITLSLSGSKYISYSTSSQGLFGVTSKFKYGDLDLSVIASKEEGQKNTMSYTGQSQADSVVFRSRDYSTRNMYYLCDPYALYDIYSEHDIGSNPRGWIGNAIKTTPSGAWIIKYPGLLPADGTVRLFYDDATTTNLNIKTPGDTIFFSPEDYYMPYYEELIEGTDFVTDYEGGYLSVLRNLDRRATLAVLYQRKDGLAVHSSDFETEQHIPNNDLIYPYVIRRRNQEYDPSDPNNVWHYQMRNVYNMNKTNIKSDGFMLDVYTLNSDNTRNYNLPDSLNAGGHITYVDYLRLDSSGDGIINGDDSTVNLAAGLVFFPFIEPFKPLGDVNVYKYEPESVSYLDIKFYISVKGKIGREAIELSQTGILKGSVRVKVNGTEQKENVDYIVDYDFGRITFLTPAGKDPDAKIEIDYENRSMFDITRKTLAGMRADWRLTDYAKLGGTLIYRSETVADKRPRIGNENIQMWLANLDGSIEFKPAFITRWIDALPLISTTRESEVKLSGEIAYTIPNIYGDAETKKKVSYVDDMESIMDSYPLGVSFNTWVMGSKPWGTSLAKGRPNWYNPKNIRREQIEDPATLTEKERRETVTVLALRHWPNTLYMPGSSVQSYSGIMKYLGNQLDFSQKKYIELYLKVDRSSGDPIDDLTLHVDLGDINEDFYTEYGGYRVLNTEDKNLDGVLTLDEDLGLDGIRHGEPGSDPLDLANAQMDSYGDYPNINGTEGNRVLDTEDLNGNGRLDTLDRYFSYSVSLADTVGQNHDGWVLYRIPLTDPEYYNIVNISSTGVPPSFKKISYARIWLQSAYPARIYIADASIVGNKWQDFHIRNAQGTILSQEELATYNSSYLTGIVSNQKNSNHYTSPPGTVYIEDRRESSESALSLDIQNLQSGHQLILRQRMMDSYNLLAYESLRYWVYPEAYLGENPEELQILFRIGADSLNYYQVSQKVPVVPYQSKMNSSNWIELNYNLQDITALKERNPGALSDTLTVGNVQYFYRGRPTLTAIREIYLGVMNPRTGSQNAAFNGTVYFNDMRVTNPYQDMGVAKRVSLNTRFADLSTLDIEYETKSENFNPVIQRGRANTYTSTETFNINNKYFLNKFFPNSWGLDIPLTLRRNYTSGKPRFRANSDLLVDKIQDPTEKERERTETLSYYAEAAFSQKSQSKNKILQYTLNKLTLSGNMENRISHTATAIDSTLSWRGTMGYNLSFANDKISIPVFKNYRIGYFPTAFSNSFSINSNDPNSYNWEMRDGAYNWHKRTQSVPTLLFTSDNNLTWPFTSDISLSARLNTKRDLLQKVYINDFNIGKQTEYVQDFGINYSPSFLPRFFNFSSSVSARFTDMMRKYYENQEGQQVEVFQRDGNSNRALRANLSLMNSNLLSSWAASMGGNRSGGKPDYKDGYYEDKDERYKDFDFNEDMGDEELKKLQKEHEEQIKREEEKRRDEARKKDEEGKRKQELLDKEEEEKWRQEEERKLAKAGELKEAEEQEETEALPEEDKEDKKKKKEPKAERPSFNPLLFVVQNLARVKNITGQYQNSYTMNYTRKSELPPFAFQLGLPHTVSRDFLDSIGDENTITLSSGLFLGRNLDSTISFAHGFNKRVSSASQQNIGITFPDITLTLMNFEPWIGMSKYLQSGRINTGFQYTTRASGDIDWDRPKQESNTISLSPLLGFSGTFLQKVSTNLGFSLSRTENITAMDDYNIIKTSDSQTLNGNIAYSFNQGRAFTIPFTGKKIHLKNQLSSSLGISYENGEDITRGRQNSTQVERSSSRLSFTPGATYQFDQNIRGGLTSSYEITEDRKRDDGTRTFSLGIWVEVNL